MGNIETGSTYTLGTVLQEVMDKNLRMFPILFKQFKHIQYAFFDVKQLAGEGGMSLKMKEIPGIESTITVDGYSVKWIDYGVFDFNTTVKGNQSITLSSFSASIDVTDSSGFAVNDSVHFILNDAGTSVEADGIVTAITDSDTIVVKFSTISGVAATTSQAFSLVAGARVERGFWKRNDNDEITRPSALYNYTEYHSYIQHFSRRIEFTKAELNKEYKYEGEAKNEAAKRFTYNLGILFQEVNKAIYKGRNVAPGSGANDKMEMLGLEEICRQSSTITDLATSTDPVRDLFKEFEYAFQTGAIVGNEPIMCMVNDKFLTELAQANADKIRYDKYVEELRYTIPTVSTIYGEVEFIRDPMMNKLYNYSACITLPRSLMKLWVRENQSYDPKGGITKADQSIRVFPVIHNLREKELFDLELELGLIAGGLSAEKVPFRFIKNFAA
jgi:hypothetical protein